MILKKIEYGITVNLEEKIYPTLDIFNSWKKDFFKMEETKDFNIYVVGSFVDIINGRFDDFDLDKIYSDEELEDMTDKELIMLDRALTNTNDIDVILIGSDKSIDDKKKIKKLMYEGMRLGWEKYGIFVDLLWFKKLEFFDIKDVKNIIFKNIF